jgi:hypothetical protein
MGEHFRHAGSPTPDRRLLGTRIMRKIGCADGDCLSSLRVAEAKLEERIRIRIRSSGRAAEKEVLCIGNERAFNVARLGGKPTSRVQRRRTSRGWLVRLRAPSGSPHRRAVSHPIREPTCARSAVHEEGDAHRNIGYDANRRIVSPVERHRPFLLQVRSFTAAINWQ